MQHAHIHEFFKAHGEVAKTLVFNVSNTSIGYIWYAFWPSPSGGSSLFASVCAVFSFCHGVVWRTADADVDFTETGLRAGKHDCIKNHCYRWLTHVHRVCCRCGRRRWWHTAGDERGAGGERPRLAGLQPQPGESVRQGPCVVTISHYLLMFVICICLDG